MGPGEARQLVLQEGVGQPHKVVRHETHAEHAHQDQHVPLGLGQLLAAPLSLTGSLGLLEPPPRAVVKTHERDKHKKESGCRCSVHSLVELANPIAVQGLTADAVGQDRGPRGHE